MKEELSILQHKEGELSHKKSDLEKQLEVSESETVSVRNQLKVAQTRIEDLQAAIKGDMDTDKDSSDEKEMSTFLEHHRRAMSVHRERNSMARESVIREMSVPRDVRYSVTREIPSISRDIQTPRVPRDIL